MDILDADYCRQIWINGSLSGRWDCGGCYIPDETQICVGFPQKPISACYVSCVCILVTEAPLWLDAATVNFSSNNRALSVKQLPIEYLIGVITDKATLNPCYGY